MLRGVPLDCDPGNVRSAGEQGEKRFTNGGDAAQLDLGNIS